MSFYYFFLKGEVIRGRKNAQEVRKESEQGMDCMKQD